MPLCTKPGGRVFAFRSATRQLVSRSSLTQRSHRDSGGSPAHTIGYACRGKLKMPPAIQKSGKSIPDLAREQLDSLRDWGLLIPVT
jgi:hypothetical protein